MDFTLNRQFSSSSELTMHDSFDFIKVILLNVYPVAFYVEFKS